jgi:hypothetical protein
MVAQLVEVLCYKTEGIEFEFRWGHWIILVYLILPAALDPGVYSVSNRNEYQKQKIKHISGSKARPARKTDLTPISEPNVYDTCLLLVTGGCQASNGFNASFYNVCRPINLI